MRLFVLLIFLVTIISSKGQEQEKLDNQPATVPAFKSGIDVVSLNVTVTDQANRFITDLLLEDFMIYEDGVRQEISFFTQRQSPVTFSLLLDTSASMDEQMTMVQEAAIGFAKRIRLEDTAGIIDFDSRVEILQAFTNDVEKLEYAIRRTSAGGSTSLYNALYISLKELQQVPLTTTENSRKAIVVLSDGEDTSSLITFEEVIDLAKRSDTVIYTIGLKSTDGRERVGFSEADFVLRQLSQETGGRTFFVEEISALPTIYKQISDELSSQYTLGYTSGNPLRNGQWRRIIVQVNQKEVTARTKQGYYAPTNS